MIVRLVRVLAFVLMGPLGLFFAAIITEPTEEDQ